MNEVKEPRSVLLEQIAYWEERKAEAAEQLRVATAVLPGLHESLRRLDRPEGETEAAVPAPSPASPAPFEEAASSPEEPEAVADGRVRLTGAEEVGGILEDLIPELPDRFTRADVDSRLTARGYQAHRSTLRSALQLMAAAGTRLAVQEEGSGRRATVFKKL